MSVAVGAAAPGLLRARSADTILAASDRASSALRSASLGYDSLASIVRADGVKASAEAAAFAALKPHGSEAECKEKDETHATAQGEQKVPEEYDQKEEEGEEDVGLALFFKQASMEDLEEEVGLALFFKQALTDQQDNDDDDEEFQIDLEALFQVEQNVPSYATPTNSVPPHGGYPSAPSTFPASESKLEAPAPAAAEASSSTAGKKKDDPEKPAEEAVADDKGEDADADANANAAADAADAAAAISQEYIALLQKQRVRATDLVTGAGAATAQKHAYSSEISNDKAGRSAKHMKRIHKELKNMKKHLPVSEGASIFIRFDKNKPYVMRALVSGPVDTPFESGLFVFDIFCPPTYPKVPPKVKLMTTGKGTVRFSPNLYREGKVCLSLLGTWKGPGWDPKKSSILQVLVSIQSLVFVERPHEMEPGFGGWGEEATQISSIRGACKGADKAKNGTCTLEMMVQQLKSHDQTDNWGGSDPEGTIQSFVMASGCVDSASDEDETPSSTGSGESKTSASASTTAAKDDKHKLVRYEKFLDEHFLDIESTRYNARIHGACLQWAINDMVENSARMYPEFVEVVGTHFAQKKESIAKTLRAWERKDRILPKRHALLVKEIAKFASTMKVDVTTKVEKIVEATEAKSAEGGASEKDQGTDPKEPSGQALEAPELIDFHLFEIEPGSEVVF